MTRRLFRSRYSATALLLTASIGVMAFAQRDTPERAAGGRIAERYCGECHATGSKDASKLEDAPPFRILHQRFNVENLPDAFADGMMVGHPRMPKVHLDGDEMAYLMAYLRAFGPAKPVCGESSCVR